jgi:kynurenine formamidase
MRKPSAFVLLGLVLAGCCQSNDPLGALKNGQWIDLTWAFDEESVYWPTNIPFTHDTISEGINQQGYYYSSFKFSAEEHGGTHFDAPIHFAEGGNSIEKVPVEQLTGEGIKIDVTAKVETDRNYQVSVADFLEWESKHGQIPGNCIVLLYTGFDKFYPDKEKYTGTTLTGAQGVENLHFPGLHPEAAIWIATERKIKGIGLDTPSIDYGQSKTFMTHRTLCAQNIAAYENVSRLSELPEKGFWVMAFPMKIKGGSGAPLRIVAFIPGNS